MLPEQALDVLDALPHALGNDGRVWLGQIDRDRIVLGEGMSGERFVVVLKDWNACKAGYAGQLRDFRARTGRPKAASSAALESAASQPHTWILKLIRLVLDLQLADELGAFRNESVVDVPCNGSKYACTS